MKFKNFIFDMDGTLWDAAQPASEGFTAAIRKDGRYDKVITIDDIHKNFGKTLYEIGANWFPDEKPEVQAELIKMCVVGQYDSMWKCEYDIRYEGVEETIKEMSKSCGLYIVSNCLDGYIEMFYDKYGQQKYFKDYAFLNHPGRNKAENIRLMVEKHGLTDAVYVGDIQGDADASAEAGVPFIHAAYGYGAVPEAKYVINKFSDLLKFVK